MKPLFTIHAGEYLVGSHIEQHFRRVKVWVPSRDTGVDLLVTDTVKKRAVTFQVKWSKDYVVTHMAAQYQKDLRASGWWTINQGKLRRSPADFWIFVLLGFAEQSTDFVIVPTTELRARLRSPHGSPKTIQSYLTVAKQNRCWETRGLHRLQLRKLIKGEYQESKRDFTRWLNNWAPVEKLSR